MNKADIAALVILGMVFAIVLLHFIIAILNGAHILEGTRHWQHIDDPIEDDYGVYNESNRN